MKIPKELFIGGHVVSIRMIKNGDLMVNGKDINGMTDKQNCLMILNEEVARSMLEETFFHELLHFCDDNERPLKEMQIDYLSRRLYAVLKNNNMLIERDAIEIEEDERRKQKIEKERKEAEEQENNEETT